MVAVNPPPQLRIPDSIRENRELFGYVEQLQQIVFQLWNRTGGSNDAISSLENEEVFDPGIQTSDADELIEGLETDISMIKGMLEEKDDHGHEIFHDLLERVRELEVDVETWTKQDTEEMEPKDFFYEVTAGRIPGTSAITKYGRNGDIDTASGFEAIWNGGGDYTGQDPTAAETLETFSSSAADAGTLLSSGTATGGSTTTLEDTGATFTVDGVAAGDVLINDTKLDHGIVRSVTANEITVRRMRFGNTNDSGDLYRVATKASTGAPVARLSFLLDGNFANETAEYIILNGLIGSGAVDTVGTYIRHSRGRCYGGDNEGEITTRQKTTTANITMVLPVGYNSTMIAAYTIPADVTKGFITTWFGALAKKQAGFSNMRLMFREVDDVFKVIEELSISSTGSSYWTREFGTPKDNIPPMTDIKIMADTSINDMGIAAGFDLITETG